MHSVGKATFARRVDNCTSGIQEVQFFFITVEDAIGILVGEVCTGARWVNCTEWTDLTTNVTQEKHGPRGAGGVTPTS